MSIRRKVFLIAAGILLIASVLSDLSARDTSIAVIVNPRNSTETISWLSCAIALVRTSDLNSSVKALKVGGRRPGSAAYPLKKSAFHKLSGLNRILNSTSLRTADGRNIL